MTTPTISVKVSLLSKDLQAAIKADGSPCKSQALVHVVDEFHPGLTAYGTYWDGGSINYYRKWQPSTSKLLESWTGEGGNVTLPPGGAVVIISFFQGNKCKPSIFIRSSDLFKVFDVTVPETMPPEIACDWVRDYGATHLSRAEYTRALKVMPVVQEAFGLVVGAV